MNPGDRREGNEVYCGECNGLKWRLLDGDIFQRLHCKCETEKLEAERQRIEAETAARQREENRRECFSDFYRFKGHTFETVSPELDHLKEAKKYVSGFSPDLKKNSGLMFFGAPGFGKSCMAACIANALIDKGFTVKIFNSASVVTNLHRSDDKKDFLHRLNSFDMIVLDDFGTENDYEENTVYMLLESRANAEKPIIITTNLTSEKLQRPAMQNKKRIYDRAFMMCPCPMEFKTKNFRRMEIVSKNKELREELEGKEHRL